MLKNILFLGLFNCLVSQIVVAMEVDVDETDMELKRIAAHIVDKKDTSLPEGWARKTNPGYFSSMDDEMEPLRYFNIMTNDTIDIILANTTNCSKRFAFSRISATEINYVITITEPHFKCGKEVILTKLNDNHTPILADSKVSVRG